MKMQDDRQRIRKITIEFDLNDERQKAAFEKIQFRQRQKYRTQEDYILKAVEYFESPIFPTVCIAEEDKKILIKEIREALYALQPGI